MPATTIVFAGIVGVTPCTARLDPGELLRRTEILLAFGDLPALHRVEKTKTIGDS